MLCRLQRLPALKLGGPSHSLALAKTRTAVHRVRAPGRGSGAEKVQQLAVPATIERPHTNPPILWYVFRTAKPSDAQRAQWNSVAENLSTTGR